jgi:hypothetical protein
VTRSAAALLAALALPHAVHAHGRSVSYSSWALAPSGAHVDLRLAALDVTLLQLDPWHDRDALAQYVGGRLGAVAGTTPCVPGPVTATEPRDGWLTLTWDVACTGPPDAIVSRLFDGVAPSHIHFARLATAEGGALEHVLTADAPRWSLAAPRRGGTAAGSSFLDYVGLGVEHIRTGFDHLAFVAALLLLAGSLGEVASIVISFTLAHSATLALAVLGVVRPEAAAVEASIGFSIALVAIENGWLLGGRDRVTPWLVVGALGAAALVAPGLVGRAALLGFALFAGCHLGLLRAAARPERLRAAVAFGFGLVHGFGFAGVLAALDLPRARLAAALLGFNVGVELGQLVIVAVGWTVLVVLERSAAGARRRVAEIGSAAIAALGLFWFVTRGW